MTISLRCVSWLVKFPLPSLTRCVPTMGKLLFKLLKNYAKAGAKVGENFEMVLSAFKVRFLSHIKTFLVPLFANVTDVLTISTDVLIISSLALESVIKRKPFLFSKVLIDFGVVILPVEKMWQFSSISIRSS